MNRRIINGGIEQALMEVANEMGELSDKDKEHLKYLQSLPQDRVEIDGVPYEVPEDYYTDKDKIKAGL
mgnify:CR=1 FL=1